MQEQNYKQHLINNIDAAINKAIELSKGDSLDVIVYEGSRELLKVAKTKGYNWESAGGYPFVHPASNNMVNNPCLKARGFGLRLEVSNF
jgi:hypothetical protein